ncbi:hypothetical protein Hanom_Chr11g01008971 [Helianthus anomalus]
MHLNSKPKTNKSIKLDLHIAPLLPNLPYKTLIDSVTTISQLPVHIGTNSPQPSSHSPEILQNDVRQLHNNRQPERFWICTCKSPFHLLQFCHFITLIPDLSPNFVWSEGKISAAAGPPRDADGMCVV